MVSHSMRVQDFEVSVHLGCEAEERRYPQPVRFQIELHYENIVRAAQTDVLTDATDYVKLADIVKKSAQAKPYKLIEHLNAEALEAVVADLIRQSFKGKVRLHVQKLQVPIEGLRGGVVFACETSI